MINAGANPMPDSETLSALLGDLDSEDYQAAISFIGYLAAMRKKKAEESRKILLEIQNKFHDDKGWESEKSMIEDMAQFRRDRMGL